jgi:hypothetical protein
MPETFNIYCDESCHLENDRQRVMTLGAVWLALDKIPEVSAQIRAIKQKHGLNPRTELKWIKISPSKQQLYFDLVDYFLATRELKFRALVAPKKDLNHAEHGQTHDEWYYKMYFDMLKIIFSPTGRYFVYLDIKDTRGGRKVHMLHDVLCNNIYDFQREIVQRVQIIRSEESQLMQLADVLIGIVSYANRDLNGNTAKMALVNHVRARTGYALTRSTLYREEKFNIFQWRPSWNEQ